MQSLSPSFSPISFYSAVALSTSSIVVTLSRTLINPSWRIGTIPFLIAKSLKKPARKSFSQKSKIPPKPRLLKMPEMSEARADALKLESPELKKLKLSRVVKQP